MRFTQEFTKPFSRLKNGLQENQPQWPILVKDDSLTVDTTLYATNFGPETLDSEGTPLNEANTPGVRLEYLLHDGTKSGLSETDEGTCTIQIANSGTYNAYAIITWPDSTQTRINFVTTSMEDGTGWVTDMGQNTDREANFGPYPVYMTLQEFCDTLDTFVKEGEVAAGSRTLQQPTGWKWKADASSANFGTQVANWGGASPETNWALAATIYMPMTANFNQLSSEIAGAQNDTGNADGTACTEPGEGQTRYNHQPDGDDSATIKYAVRGTSGDNLQCIRWGGFGEVQAQSDGAGGYIWGTQYGDVYKDIQANHGHASGPKWRMKTALALFLKDGTYTISGGGTIIPYTYDPDRLIGGFKSPQDAQQTYMYGMWDGGADALAENTDDGSGSVASAQIFPGYFVQGPVCPPPQASNRVPDLGYSYQWGDKDTFGEVYNPAVLPDSTADRLQHANAGTASMLPNPIRKNATQYQKTTAGGGEDILKLDFTASGGHNLEQTADFGGAYIFIHSTPTQITQAAFATAFEKTWFPVEVLNSNELIIHVDTLLIPTWTTFGGYDASYQTGNTEVSIGVQWEYMSTLMMDGQPDGGIWFSTGGSLRGEELLGQTTGHMQLSEFNTEWPGKGAGRFSRYPKWFGIGVDSGSTPTTAWQPAMDAQTPFSTCGGALRISTGKFGRGAYRGGVDADRSIPYAVHWQSNSVETILLSKMDGESGKHAWSEIKPSFTGGHASGETSWPMGRNRNWPGHHRTHGDAYGVAPSLESSSITTYSHTHPEAGIRTKKFGLTELGSSPIYLDMEMTAYIPGLTHRMVKIWFHNENYDTPHRGFLGAQYSEVSTASDFVSFPWWQGQSIVEHIDGSVPSSKGGAWGHKLTGYGTATSSSYPDGTYDFDGHSHSHDANLMGYVAPQPWLWYYGGADLFSQVGNWSAGTYPPSGGEGGGFGLATDGIGQGGTFTGSKGTNTWRVTFDNRGMQFLLNGDSQGFDKGAGSPVHSFDIHYASLIWSGNPFTNALGANNTPDINKADPDRDLAIDSLKLRQIPTPVMLPFLAETVKIEKSAGIYRTLTLFAENIDASKNQLIKVSICTPGDTSGVWDGYGRAPGTPLENFTSLDPQIIGGFGSVSLTELPTAIVENGFTIRFEYHIPHNATEETIDWSAVPKITTWRLDYDLKPTAALAVIGETFQNDLTSPIDTKVGHIVTFEGTLSTPDPDRTINEVKYDFGDGVTTEWIAVTTPAASVVHSIVHSYSAQASSLNAVVYSKDDNGNISDASTAIVVNIAGAEPQAVLRAIPQVVRAGQSVTLDASASFDPDGTTLQNFRFTSGDGSSVIGPQATNYAQHTYATAGEYKATMTVEDASGNTSNTASAIIKVLPANLVIPLTLNTRPSGFSRNRRAEFSSTPVLDSAFPEMRDQGIRGDEFQLTGTFLKDTADADIAYMEELLMSGSLVEFEWQSVNYQGVADSKTFIGRMTDFQYRREASARGQTSYTATFVRESNLGV